MLPCVQSIVKYALAIDSEAYLQAYGLFGDVSQVVHMLQPALPSKIEYNRLVGSKQLELNNSALT